MTRVTGLSGYRYLGCVPTPPPADVLELHDSTPDEIESRAELDHHLHKGSLAGLTVQGLRLDQDPVPDLTDVDLSEIQLARNPGYARLPGGGTQTLYYGERGSENFEGYGLVDFAATYEIPIWRTVRPW